MICLSFQTAALYSKVCPTIKVRPLASAVSTSASATATEVANGFSTMVCSPARNACSATGPWLLGGVAMTTASNCVLIFVKTRSDLRGRKADHGLAEPIWSIFDDREFHTG